MDRMTSKKAKVKRKKGRALLLLPFAFLLFTSCGAGRGDAVPAGATSGYCPVCRMKVNVSDNWAAEIYYNDGKKLMFESPGDMLAFYTSPNSYDAGDAHKDRANIERITVKDYQSKQTVDAREAKFVYKSKVEGPMGPDFLPFGKREDAETFVGANGGTVLSLNEVTGEMARDVRK
ncbi:MAG: nitrous oxide reductase accessory protein NosL [Acidobacteriota bacterium]